MEQGFAFVENDEFCGIDRWFAQEKNKNIWRESFPLGLDLSSPTFNILSNLMYPALCLPLWDFTNLPRWTRASLPMAIFQSMLVEVVGKVDGLTVLFNWKSSGFEAMNVLENRNGSFYSAVPGDYSAGYKMQRIGDWVICLSTLERVGGISVLILVLFLWNV